MTNNEFVIQGQPSFDLERFPDKEETLLATKHYALKTAGFWIRLWAFLLDGLIISAVVGILVNPIFYLMDWSLSETVWYAPISIISAIIYYGYFVLMTKFLGQTLGKMACGLRVVSLKHDKLTWSDVLFRDWIGRFISNIFMPLYIFVAILPDNQGLHDFFAETTVVHEKIYVEKKEESIASPLQKKVPEPEKLEQTIDEKIEE
ncbi:putative RDD family membrane protein YckC [Lysinibacillus parviboronicapiens]|uniref:RDD family membrane protein YckC n=1 Tax=Lysinibacillus parviboronicapiens TaxID=436516 RepID=A0ABV2PJ14_9BACI